MVLFTTDGRFVWNNIIADDGDLVILEGGFLIDMENLIVLIDHSVPAYKITNGLQTKAVVGSLVNYEISVQCTNNIDPGVPLMVEVNIPSGFSLVNSQSDEGAYNAGLGVWLPTLVNQRATLNLILSVDTAGSYTQTVTITDYATTKDNISVISATDTGTITYTDAIINDAETLANLQDGQTYTLIAYNLVTDTGITGIYEGIRNNRLAIINDTVIQYGSRVIEQGVYQKTKVSFIYDATKTLKIRLYGQYQAASTVAVDHWAGFTLIEGTDGNISEAQNLLANPEALFDGSTSSDLFLPGGMGSAPYQYQTDAVSIAEGEREFAKGIMITLGVTGGPGEVQVQLISSSGALSEVKSAIIDGTQSQVTLGGEHGTWGLKPEDINQKSLTLVLTAMNTSLTEETLELSNLFLTVYTAEDLTRGASGLTYKGEHSRNYGLIITDISNPEGVDPNIETLVLPSKDGELITNHTIQAKTIEVEFLIYGETLEDAKSNLHLIGSWLTNDRNELFIPVPEELVFDYDPTKRYMAILGADIQNTIDYSAFICKAKFIVPDGVAYNTELTTTGSVGVNQGKVKVYPTIQLVTSGADNITITDAVTGQEIIINAAIPQNMVLTVNCEDQTITDHLGNDYSTYAGVETVWFGFVGAYNLSCTGGVIQSVEYYEGG